jgi:hypothetical protein
MSKETPTHFYKYRALDSGEQRNRLRQILLESKLYFPNSDQFNDPFDCAPVSVWESTKRDVKRWAMGVFRRRQPWLSRNERRRKVKLINTNQSHLEAANETVLKNLVNSVGVFSLSARCDQILMWSHYSDSHSGVCLRFASDNEFFGRAFPVDYHKERPRVGMLMGAEQDRVKKSLLTKADFWAYEEEWRIIEMGGPKRSYVFPPRALDGIILGARISDEDKAFVLETISQRSVPTHALQARIHPELFRITIANV